MNALLSKIDAKAVYVLVLLALWVGMDVAQIDDARLFDILYSLLIGLGVLHVKSQMEFPK